MSKSAGCADQKHVYPVDRAQYRLIKRVIEEYATANGGSESYLSSHLFTLGLCVPLMRYRFGVVHLDMDKTISILLDRVLGIHAVDDPRRPLTLQSAPLRQVYGSDPMDVLNIGDAMFEVAVVLWPQGYGERFHEACVDEGPMMEAQTGVEFDFHRAGTDSRKYQAIERLLCPSEYYNRELCGTLSVAS